MPVRCREREAFSNLMIKSKISFWACDLELFPPLGFLSTLYILLGEANGLEEVELGKSLLLLLRWDNALVNYFSLWEGGLCYVECSGLFHNGLCTSPSHSQSTYSLAFHHGTLTGFLQVKLMSRRVVLWEFSSWDFLTVMEVHTGLQQIFKITTCGFLPVYGSGGFCSN